MHPAHPVCHPVQVHGAVSAFLPQLPARACLSCLLLTLTPSLQNPGPRLVRSRRIVSIVERMKEVVEQGVVGW